jgi:plasmid stabilization system protein ParE
MSCPLIFHPSVDDDVEDARQFYESKQTGLGDRFEATVEAVEAGIAATPLMHQMIYRTVRRSLVPKFPYGVFYRIVGTRVEVIAVYNLRRDPAGWQSRV